ncbi:4-hydroxy-tetrahydrodipicolinate synthase [Terrilactibacillus sp. BCM23-1]|uniref:4-hydroxy-tetrahydrodipicolinate synthase n=1 Tax=Terrilactibacillus tamarindi TaxID=2599694 RepID=A0A6N8CRP9_9BACI|nr:4-hydroxy-tetrahydrodipicolinate synthase [Terrilactibacillus tamarindi]MTT32862.1 4-hydroxy-tetrahydrodipicolinate synthase [Terrilactibacillus tamarindi]
MRAVDFGTLLTAMVTPFDDDGNVSYDKVTQLVEHLIKSKSEGIVVAGTTGESPTLTLDEKLKLFEHVVNVAGGRVKVIAGTGNNNTKETIAFSKKVEALGVDALMLVAPYYSKPNQKGLYEHFKTIAENVTKEVMIYNIPGRSSVNVSAETIIALSKIKNITSVKEASGNLDQIATIIEGTDDDFYVYSGDDGLTLPILSVGGHGVISVASHVIGEQMREMIDLFKVGQNEKAAKIHLSILPLMRELFKAPNPVPVKTLLNRQGIDVGSVRLPMVNLTETEEKELLDIASKTLQPLA